MKKICKIGMLAFAMLAIGTLIACGEEETTVKSSSLKQKEKFVFDAAPFGKFERDALKTEISKDIIHTFTSMGEIDVYVEAAPITVMRDENIKMYVMNIKQDGEFVAWTEGDCDTRIAFFNKPEKSEKGSEWKNYVDREERNFDEKYNDKISTSAMKGKGYIAVMLENAYDITEEDIKAGKVFFTLKTAFTPD